VAEHADIWNTFLSTPEELDHKLEVLAGHCADVGRDPSTINKTSLSTVIQAATMEEAEQLRNGFLKARGLDWDTLDDATRTSLSARLVVGDPDAVGEQVQRLIGLGLDGVTFNLPATGHDPQLVGDTVATMVKAVG
jgi:alkanesulfonate monooxygenase SsuD/methylene tetrahydromethanopterin reductase-like flavin-dependent oxidoreductase (luciferase family)